MPARLPLRIRLAVAVVVLAVVAVVGAGTAAVQYGAWALDAGGAIQTAPASRVPHWVGYDLYNRSAVPVTLRAWVPRELTNVRVLETRVADVRNGFGFGFIGAPLPGDLGAKVAASVPVDGFVVPPGSRSQYEVIVLVQQIDTGTAAEVGPSVVAYRALGFDQGTTFELISRYRAG